MEKKKRQATSQPSATQTEDEIIVLYYKCSAHSSNMYMCYIVMTTESPKHSNPTTLRANGLARD